MVEYGQYPLVLQLQNGLPVGLAESTGNFSSINLIVSSVSANEYLGLTGSVTIPLPIIQGGTGATGITDAQINLGLEPGVDVQTHSGRLDDISLAIPTENYFIVGDGSNWKSIPPGDARTSLSLVPGTHVQIQNANLQALAGAALAQNQILVGGAAGAITTISTPTDGNYLKYNTVGGFSWAAGGSVNLPDVQYAVLYDNGSDTFASDQNVKIQNGVFSASNASAVNSSANTFYENGQTLATKYQPYSSKLVDIAALNANDSNIIVGNNTTWVAESGSTARTSLGLGTTDSPHFNAVNIGNAADTTVARSSAGNISVAGNVVYRAGGTTIPVADGGTGKSSFNADQIIYGNAFGQSANLTFDGTTLKCSNASANNASANTIYENGVNISTKYWLASNGNLLNLNDVNLDLGTLSPGDVLKYNGSKWVNDTDNTGAGGSPGGDLNNVQINYAGNFSGNDGLKYNLNTSTLTGSTFSATVVSAGTLHIGGSDGYIVNNNGAIWISATDTIKVIPGLSATSWFGLPSGLDASSLKGYPIVSSYQGPETYPTNGQTLLFFEAPVSGWYYGTPAAGAGGSNNQIQYNSGGGLVGSPALTWDNSTSTLVSKQLSATTYLNLPSGTAIWNANKIQGYDVTGDAPAVGSLFIYNFPNGAANAWQYYGAEDLGELAIFNAEKLQSRTISTATPIATQHLEYDGTSWKPEWNSVSTIDSTVTLTNTCDEKLFVSSSGSKVTVTLPDPTTCAGKEIQVIKADPSGMPVYVSATTLQSPGNLIAMRIPRDMVQVISDGTNWYVQHNNSSYGGSHEVGSYDVEFEDFIWGSTETGEVGIRNWSFTNGSVAVVNNTGADGTGRGVINRQSGTTANQVASFYPMAAGTNTPNYANEVLDFKIRQYPTNIAAYKIRFGMFSDMTADPPASGIYFECSSGQSNYQAITRNGAVETKTDTAVAVDTAGFSTFRIFRRSDSAIEFYINDNIVATNTANIPSQHAITFGYQCIPTTTTPKGSYIDYIAVAIVDTTQRY